MVAMQDSGVNEIVSSPQAYEAYLEIQANNPVYSAGNVALAYVQNPNVTQFGTVDRWKTLGRSVKVSEKNNGIQIFAKGSFSKTAINTCCQKVGAFITTSPFKADIFFTNIISFSGN